VQVPSDDVTKVRPLELDVDMLLDPVPGPACVVTEGPAPVVEPETLPPRAVTELLRPSAEDAELLGGFSPGFRWTVLQLLFGLDVEVLVLPSEDAELDELELSAWADAATAIATAAQQNADGFMGSPALCVKRTRCSTPRGHCIGQTRCQ